MSGNPKDYGDRNPSDLDDVAPQSPTLNYSETSAAPPGKPAPLSPLTPFNPGHEIIYPQERLRYAFMGRFVQEVSESRDDIPRYYEVLLQNGIIIVAKVLLNGKYEYYKIGGPCIVTRGEEDNEWLAFGIPHSSGKSLYQQQDVVSFTLTADLVGSSATADIALWLQGSGAYGTPFAGTVIDPTGLFSGFETGDSGLAWMRLNGSEEIVYEIIYMDPTNEDDYHNTEIEVITGISWDGSTLTFTRKQIRVHDPVDLEDVTVVLGVDVVVVEDTSWDGTTFSQSKKTIKALADGEASLTTVFTTTDCP